MQVKKMNKKKYNKTGSKNNFSKEALTKLREASKEDIALALMAENFDIDRAFQEYKKGYLERKKSEIS
jgi:hypothetical protein